MPTRREFLVQGALASFAARFASPFSPSPIGGAPSPDEPIFVVVQLDGGNDGLNTVVPFEDDVYHRLRPTIALPKSRLLKMGDGTYWNAALEPLMPSHAAGEVAVMRAVGHADADRSHFTSLARWHGGGQAINESRPSGWLGRAVDALPIERRRPPVFVGTSAMPPALYGQTTLPVCLAGLDDLVLPLRPAAPPASGDAGSLIEHAKAAVAAAVDLGARLERVGCRTPPTARTSPIAHDLDIVARLILSDAPNRIFYVTHGNESSVNGSYDTHSDQTFIHDRLLAELAAALAAFRTSLVAAKLWTRVSVFIFSEFGRRVDENGTRGTDHGTAGLAFLLGGHITGGLLGPAPDLTDLDDGAARFTLPASHTLTFL